MHSCGVAQPGRHHPWLTRFAPLTTCSVYTHVTFTFATEPVLEDIFPDFLPPGGGARVTISGTFLDSAVYVGVSARGLGDESAWA